MKKFFLSVFVVHFVLNAWLIFPLQVYGKERLVKKRAFWPMIRHDSRGSGLAVSPGPKKPKVLWKARGKFTIPVIDASGRLYFGINNSG